MSESSSLFSFESWVRWLLPTLKGVAIPHAPCSLNVSLFAAFLKRLSNARQQPAATRSSVATSRSAAGNSAQSAAATNSSSAAAADSSANVAATATSGRLCTTELSATESSPAAAPNSALSTTGLPTAQLPTTRLSAAALSTAAVSTTCLSAARLSATTGAPAVCCHDKTAADASNQSRSRLQEKQRRDGDYHHLRGCRCDGACLLRWPVFLSRVAQRR